jgi:predicted nucleotidyltransferase
VQCIAGADDAEEEFDANGSKVKAKKKFGYLSKVKDLSIIQNYLKNQPVLKAYLFGSYARGDEDETSDFDLLVELDEHVGLYKFVAIQLGLENLLGKKVDLISSKSLSPRLRPYIDKDKKLIYERRIG